MKAIERGDENETKIFLPPFQFVRVSKARISLSIS